MFGTVGMAGIAAINSGNAILARGGGGSPDPQNNGGPPWGAIIFVLAVLVCVPFLFAMM